MFLFNDIIVYSHSKSGTTYQYKGTILLGTTWIRDLEDTEKAKNLFQIVTEKKTWTFMAETAHKKMDWMGDIQFCIDQLVKMNPDFINQRGQVKVSRPRLGPLLSLKPEDYDKELQLEKQKEEEKKRFRAESKASWDSPVIYDEENALLEKTKPKSSCCNII